MKSLSPEYGIDSGELSRALSRLSGQIEAPSINVGEVRSGLELKGFCFEKIPLRRPSEKSSFLCVDSSFIGRNLRFHGLWGIHCVCLHAVFAAAPVKDYLVGQGSVMYENLLYDSVVEFGVFKPYSDVDVRINLLRIGFELSFLLECKRRLASEGRGVDFLVLDGSLKAIESDIGGRENYAEYSRAFSSLNALSGEKVVAMVEDSHASDLSAKAGFNFTNVQLFDLILEPGEFVVAESGGVHVAYVKLASKSLCHTPERKSEPFTVRWEFNYPDFRKDLEYLVGVWSEEDDLMHPQIYPLRITDYLTRKISVGAILDEHIKEKNLSRMFRDSRTG